VQKSLWITTLKSKLRSSYPFGNALVTNEDRRQIVGESRQKLRILRALTPRLLDGSSPNLARYSLIIAIEPFESGFMIGQSVVECQSKE